MSYTKITKPSTPSYNCISKIDNTRTITIDELGDFSDTIDTLNTVATTIDALGLVTTNIYHKITKPTL